VCILRLERGEVASSSTLSIIATWFRSRKPEGEKYWIPERNVFGTATPSCMGGGLPPGVALPTDRLQSSRTSPAACNASSKRAIYS